MKNDSQLDKVKNKGPDVRPLIYLYIWCLMLSLFGSAPVLGQHYNFRTFTMEEGLGESVVNTIFQDKKGYLWIGTYGGGVDRYDGASFTNYSTKNGLSDNSVFCIIGDRKENLWIGTANGLTKYNGRHFTSYSSKDGLSGNFIWKIVEDRKGHLWLATDTNGVSRFDGTGFTNLTTAQGLIDNEVRSILEDRKGNIWIGTLKGASKYDGTTFTNDAVTQRLKGHFIQTIMEDSRGNLWFGTRENGVLCVDIKTLTFTQYTTREGLCGNDVFDIMQDSSGHLWFSTYYGASKFDGRSFTNYTPKQGLRHNLTNCTLEDREGNFWFGTALGLSRFRGENLTYFNEKDGLKCNFVWSIWEDSNGTMWFGTEQGISKYDRKTGKITMASGNYGTQDASPFYEDSKGNLWFGTREAIIKYDGQAFKNFSKKTGMGIVNIYSIMEDNRGYMWFGTELGGVKVWDGKTVKSFTRENGLPHNFVNTLLEDTQGNIWAGTEKGLSRYNGANFTHVSFAGGLNTRSIMCMKEDSEKNVWIGTFGGGVVRFMPHKDGKPAVGSFATFTTEDGLLDDEIFSMVFDNDGNLWIASKRGISVLDSAEFSQTGRRKFKYYGKDDGFIGIEPNDNAVFKDKDGNIWFGTLNGAIKFNPKKDKPNTIKPTICITGLKLFLEEVNWSTRWDNPLNEFGLPVGLEMSHIRNHLTFEFVGICLTVPEKVRYHVKLEGFDEHWSPVSKATYATYSNLPPGAYAFKVRACNNEGLWNKEPAVYRFRITPPYWQTWWFYLMVLIAGSGILYGFIRLRVQTLKKQKRVLEEQVRSRTLELEEEKTKVEQINRELEQRVEERTRKLAAANEKLLNAQKMEAIGTLASGVAHDLNNILAGIVTYPDFLLTEMPEESPLRSYVLEIQQSGEKAAAIVRDLLSLAKRGAKMMKVVNLNRVISGFTQSPELKKIMTKNPGVQLETRLEEGLPNMMGSPVHLSKALMNLVSNAVEAMPHGGKINITTKDQYVDQHTDKPSEVKEGAYAMVIVSDTGKGMSEQEVKRIFEPFYSRKKGEGTGLGLAVVWGTVQDHKGFITVQSHQGRGTSFTLYFPTTHQKLVEEKKALSINELMGNGESILVVDDIEQQREVASLVLRKLGYRVNAVASGEDAIEYLKEHPVDLLVLDMIMEQGISGLETYKRVLQMYPHQKAILVSGYSETAEVKEALQLGAGCYVKKPYHIEKIGKAIKEELNKQ